MMKLRIALGAASVAAVLASAPWPLIAALLVAYILLLALLAHARREAKRSKATLRRLEMICREHPDEVPR